MGDLADRELRREMIHAREVSRRQVEQTFAFSVRVPSTAGRVFVEAELRRALLYVFPRAEIEVS